MVEDEEENHVEHKKDEIFAIGESGPLSVPN